MPYKNYEQRKARSKEYYWENRETVLAKNKEYSATHKSNKKAYDAVYGASYSKAHPERAKEYSARFKAKHPERVIFRSARLRAKKMGWDFSIVESDIIIPKVCPVFGFPLVINTRKNKEKRNGMVPYNSPTIDRIDNTKGYVKGNIWIISWRANHLKNDGTLQEHELLVAALQKVWP